MSFVHGATCSHTVNFIRHILKNIEQVATIHEFNKKVFHLKEKDGILSGCGEFSQSNLYEAIRLFFNAIRKSHHPLFCRDIFQYVQQKIPIFLNGCNVYFFIGRMWKFYGWTKRNHIPIFISRSQNTTF